MGKTKRPRDSDGEGGQETKRPKSNDFTPYVNKKFEDTPGGSHISSTISPQHTSHPPRTPSNTSKAIIPSEISPPSNQSNSHIGSPDVNRITPIDEKEFETGPGGKQYPHSRRKLMFEAGSGVKVEPRVRDGMYNLSISRINVLCSTDQDKEKNATEMAENAGKLFLQAEMLREMGEQLLAQSRTVFQSMFLKSAP